MKRKIMIVAVIFVIAVLAFAVISCEKNGNNKPTEVPKATDNPTEVPEPTDVPTATPEPTPEPTATPVPEPGTYDLLNFEADEDHMVGDGWDIVDGAWAGPLEEPGNAENGAKLDGVRINGHREVYATELSNGEVGAAIRLAIDGDEGIRWLGNRYGIGDIGLKPNQKYRIEATFYLSGSTVDGYISCIGYAEGKGATSYFMEITPKDEWQTVELTFTTSANIDMPNIVLGPDNWAGHCNYDYEIMIERVELFEVVEEAPVEEDDDLLKFKPLGSAVDGDTWSVADGKFCGPLQAPDAGTEGEAKKDGKIKYASRKAVSTTLSDGSTGMAIKHSLEADEGFRNSGNYFGIPDIGLKGNTTYIITAVVKTNALVTDMAKCVLGFTSERSGLNSQEKVIAYTEIAGSDEWQTVTLELTTPETLDRPCIVIGPNSLIGEINAGYEMYIESVKIVEKTVEYILIID